MKTAGYQPFTGFLPLEKPVKTVVDFRDTISVVLGWSGTRTHTKSAITSKKEAPYNPQTRPKLNLKTQVAPFLKQQRMLNPKVAPFLYINQQTLATSAFQSFYEVQNKTAKLPGFTPDKKGRYLIN